MSTIEREIRRVIAGARRNGVEIDRFEAETYILARKILKAHPENEAALEVITRFREHLRSGVENLPFQAFMISASDAEPGARR